MSGSMQPAEIMVAQASDTRPIGIMICQRHRISEKHGLLHAFVVLIASGVQRSGGSQAASFWRRTCHVRARRRR
jgi:hypothetical protein